MAIILIFKNFCPLSKKYESETLNKSHHIKSRPNQISNNYIQKFRLRVPLPIWFLHNAHTFVKISISIGCHVKIIMLSGEYLVYQTLRFRPEIQESAPFSFWHWAPILGILGFHVIKITVICQVRVTCIPCGLRVKINTRETSHSVWRSWTHFVCVCFGIWVKRVTLVYLYHVNRCGHHKNCRLQSNWTLYKSADCRWISTTKLCVSFTNSATLRRLEQVQLCNRLIDQSADNITGLKCAKECLIHRYRDRDPKVSIPPT